MRAQGATEDGAGIQLWWTALVDAQGLLDIGIEADGDDTTHYHDTIEGVVNVKGVPCLGDGNQVEWIRFGTTAPDDLFVTAPAI